MAQQTAEKPVVMVQGQPRTPPDEQFWQRYSPHFEFPLSGIGSAALHIVVIALLLLAAWVAAKFLFHEENTPSMDAIVLGGGGGSSTGVKGSTGGGGNPGGNTGSGEPTPMENTGNKDPNDPKPKPKFEFKELPKDGVDPLRLTEYKDAGGQQIVKEGNDIIARIGAVNEDVRKSLFNGLKDKGKGGDGNGGGTGSGTGGTGGEGTGDGKGKLTDRQKRLLRWTMVFDTTSPNNYADQLAALGAMIAVPEGKSGYRLFTDLRQRPVQGEVKDLSEIKSIYWVDDRPLSVGNLCKALGVRSNPDHFVAFFPIELEDRLAKMERDHKGLREDQIDSTVFRIMNNRPTVESQTPLSK